MDATLTTGARRAVLAVADAMTRDPIVLRSDDALVDAARVLDEARISGAPVVDAAGTLVGVLSRTDLLHARATAQLWERWSSLQVRHLMRSPAITAIPSMGLDEAATIMEREGVHRLVVVMPGHVRPVGILSTTDLVHATLRRP
ncbi:MAG: CBS domain-containing protein [Chloroflexota bacterium]